MERKRNNGGTAALRGTALSCQVCLCQFPELSLLKYTLSKEEYYKWKREQKKKKKRKVSKRRGQKVPDKSNPGGQSENKLKEPL